LNYQVTITDNRVIGEKWSDYDVTRRDNPKHVILHRNCLLNVKQIFRTPESNILFTGNSVLLKIFCWENRGINL